MSWRNEPNMAGSVWHSGRTYHLEEPTQQNLNFGERTTAYLLGGGGMVQSRPRIWMCPPVHHPKYPAGQPKLVSSRIWDRDTESMMQGDLTYDSKFFDKWSWRHAPCLDIDQPIQVYSWQDSNRFKVPNRMSAVCVKVPAEFSPELSSFDRWLRENGFGRMTKDIVTADFVIGYWFLPAGVTAQYWETSTDRFHLYFNGAAMTWSGYRDLLEWLAELQIIELNYYRASVADGATFLRFPSVPRHEIGGKGYRASA